MAEKAKSTPKPEPRYELRAIVQLDKPECIEVEDGGDASIENWPEDGKDNIIPVGKPFQCSIHLAERLKNAGRIRDYSTTKVLVG